MKKKISGEKILLALGGIGIVAAVAVIVFLISYNIGGDVPVPEKTTQSQNQAATTQVANVSEPATVTHDDTIGVSQVVDADVESACKGAVKLFADCFINGKPQEMRRLLPDSVWDAMSKNHGTTTDVLIDLLADALQGKGAGATYTVTSVLTVAERDAKAIREALSSKHGFGAADVTDVYAVSIKLDYSADGKNSSEKDELYCVKINGQWYLSEKDCLAAYYLLNQ